MELHNLKKVEGSTHSGKRVGRGLGSGMGKTSTRGQKGAGARSGGAINPGFEGGQTPLYRRLPKKGFKNINRKEYALINISDFAKVCEYLKGEKEYNIDLETLMAIGFINKPLDGLKVLGDGDLNLEKGAKLVVTCAKISATAREKIEKAGGTISIVAEK